VLTPEQDAFGAALLDHLFERPAPAPLLMEFDNGAITPALPPAWFFQPPSEWDDLEHAVLSAVRRGPVLDLGAGAGRHSLLLQELGLPVTAVDISPGAIEVCRHRGVGDARVADLTDPPTDQRWAAVLLMCGNLGLAGGWDETRQLLTRLAVLCADDAVLVADSVDPTDTPGERDAVSQRDVHSGLVTLRLRYGAAVSPWTRLLNVAIVDVEPLLEDTGWRLDRHELQGSDHYLVLRRQPRASAS
jgi:SAM-dependent methyltransferase